MCIIYRSVLGIISQTVSCVNWKPLFFQETTATEILILWECYVMEVTITSYLLATGTAASPAEALSTSHPCCLPCPYPPALTPIVSWIYPHRLNVVAVGFLLLWNSNASAGLTGGGVQVIIETMRSGCQYRWRFASLPAMYSQLCGPVPNRLIIGHGPWIEDPCFKP